MTWPGKIMFGSGIDSAFTLAKVSQPPETPWTTAILDSVSPDLTVYEPAGLLVEAADATWLLFRFRRSELLPDEAVLLDALLLDPVVLDPVLLDPVLLDPGVLDPVLLDPVLFDEVSFEAVLLDSVLVELLPDEALRRSTPWPVAPALTEQTGHEPHPWAASVRSATAIWALFDASSARPAYAWPP
jgi:hypothetical protein